MEKEEAREGGDVQEKRRVMVAIDDSECSHYALEWALENLRDCIAAPGAAPLVVFTVQPLANLSYIPAATYGSAPPELIRSLQEHQRKISLALLEHAKEICAKYGLNAETITEVGDPKDTICEAVAKYKVNLLILGSHGRGMFQSHDLGYLPRSGRDKESWCHGRDLVPIREETYNDRSNARPLESCPTPRMPLLMSPVGWRISYVPLLGRLVRARAIGRPALSLIGSGNCEPGAGGLL